MGAASTRSGDARAIVLVAGFGDDASMYDGLLETPLATRFELHAIDLPGFGAPPLAAGTSLASLARFVAQRAQALGARIAVGHSLGSVVVSLAASEPGSSISRIVSLEGNLTAEDAYFSGTASEYADPTSFRTAFLARLDDLGASDPIVARYRHVVARADPRALWELGNDAHRFSAAQAPGEVLVAAARTTYVYDPANCPERSLAWLRGSDLEQLACHGASHWMSVDQPEALAAHLLAVLDQGLA